MKEIQAQHHESKKKVTEETVHVSIIEVNTSSG